MNFLNSENGDELSELEELNKEEEEEQDFSKLTGRWGYSHQAGKLKTTKKKLSVRMKYIKS